MWYFVKSSKNHNTQHFSSFSESPKDTKTAEYIKQHTQEFSAVDVK